MRKLLFVGVAAALTVVVVRRPVAPRLARLMEPMMEQVMPRMMDSCFSEMSPERRQFMLAHCRGMLDQVEEKYVTEQVA
ncbi:MAG: hypothetical protein V3R95_07330 [Dehalococcoidia bacterium]